MTTKIEWTDETWNPVTGCTKVSQGCKNCYAERLAPKVFAGQKVPNWIATPDGRKADGRRPRVFTDILTHPDRLDAPLHWKKPRRIFVNSMSDLFHEDVPDEFIDRVWTVMTRCHVRNSGHTFQILTKRAQRMRDFVSQIPSPPGSIWLGVSVEDQATADERIPLLLQTPAAIRFLSCEPLLGPIDLTRYFEFETDNNGPIYPGVQWVIAGGESGPKGRPSHPDWFSSLRDDCAAAQVPFFFKQWGEWAPLPPMEGLTNGKRGMAIDAHGKPPGPEDLDRIIAGDTSILAGRVHMSRVGKKAAGRTLDGRIHDEWPA